MTPLYKLETDWIFCPRTAGKNGRLRLFQLALFLAQPTFHHQIHLGDVDNPLPVLTAKYQRTGAALVDQRGGSSGEAADHFKGFIKEDRMVCSGMP